MTVLASAILDRVSKQLVDKTNIRWPRTQLLDWLSVGQRFIVTLQPHTASTTLTMKLSVGTRQVVSADSVVVIFDVVRNMGTDGQTPGRVIRQADRDLLDRCLPSWHSTSQSPVVQSYTLDPCEPYAFWVYPPSNGTNYVQLRYAPLPAHLASEAAALSIPDKYEDALNHYVMFRALSKHAEFASSPDAEKYLALFNAAIGATATAQQASAQS